MGLIGPPLKNPTPFRGPDTRLTFGSRPSLSVSLAALSTPPSEWVRPTGGRRPFSAAPSIAGGSAGDIRYLERPPSDANRALVFSLTFGTTGTLSRPAVTPFVPLRKRPLSCTPRSVQVRGGCPRNAQAGVEERHTRRGAKHSGREPVGTASRRRGSSSPKPNVIS